MIATILFGVAFEMISPECSICGPGAVWHPDGVNHMAPRGGGIYDVTALGQLSSAELTAPAPEPGKGE